MRWMLVIAFVLASAAALAESPVAPITPDGLAGPCAGFYSEAFTPVVGRAAIPQPDVPRPRKGEIHADPAFGTCVVRATDHHVEVGAGFLRNDYSRRQAFNADQSRMIVYAEDGTWHLYDAATLAYLRPLEGLAGDAEPQWHPTDPRRLYWLPIDGGMEMYTLDVETRVSSVATRFSGTLPWPDAARVMTRSEGSASADGRYWCFQVETEDFRILGVITYDLAAHAVIGLRALEHRPDHVSMSPSGRWCVVGQIAGEGGTVAWRADFTVSRPLHATSEHSDIAVGPDGHDVFVFVDYQSNGGDLTMVDLDTGSRTALFPTYIDRGATAYHVSGKAFSTPGWVLLSTYARTGVERWLHERIMAVPLCKDPSVIHIAHHHSRAGGYWAEPQASVSRDFTRVLFNSNWGAADPDDVDAYLVQLPPGLLADPASYCAPGS